MAQNSNDLAFITPCDNEPLAGLSWVALLLHVVSAGGHIKFSKEVSRGQKIQDSFIYMSGTLSRVTEIGTGWLGISFSAYLSVSLYYSSCSSYTVAPGSKRVKRKLPVLLTARPQIDTESIDQSTSKGHSKVKERRNRLHLLGGGEARGGTLLVAIFAASL